MVAMRGRKSKKEEEGLMMNKLGNDMLGEILSRVRDSKTAIRSSSVCKAWKSVITSPEFVPAFNRKHSNPSSPSYTMFVDFGFNLNPEFRLLRYSDKVFTVEGSSEVASDSSATLLHEILQYYRLESTCHDLILMATRSGSEFCVCRPVSRQRHVIPSLSPLHNYGGFRVLAARPDSHEFRIVHMGVVDGWSQSTIFSSESGRWSEPAKGPSFCRRSDVVTTSEGKIFWVDDFRDRRAVVFDPFGGRDGSWQYIDLPGDMAGEDSKLYEFAPPGEEASEYGFDKYRVCMGAVQGRVRISQLIWVTEFGTFGLFVWELEDDEKSWRRVHSIPVGTGDEDTKWVYALALDPHDGDSVYLCHDSNVYRYCLGKMEFSWVFKLSCSMKHLGRISEDLLPRYAHASFLTRSLWPAPVPSFESAQDDIFYF